MVSYAYPKTYEHDNKKRENKESSNKTLSLLFNSPLQLVIRRRVLGGDVSQVSKDLGAVDGEAGEQDELLPGGAEQAGVVLYGKLAEEWQLLDPGDLAEEQLVRQATQQGEQLHLCHFVPERQTRATQGQLW